MYDVDRAPGPLKLTAVAALAYVAAAEPPVVEILTRKYMLSREMAPLVGGICHNSTPPEDCWEEELVANWKWRLLARMACAELFDFSEAGISWVWYPWVSETTPVKWGAEDILYTLESEINYRLR